MSNTMNEVKTQDLQAQWRMRRRDDLAATAQASEPSGYIHPDQLLRLERGESTWFRREPYKHTQQIAVYIGAAPATKKSKPKDDDMFMFGEY